MHNLLPSPAWEGLLLQPSAMSSVSGHQWGLKGDRDVLCPIRNTTQLAQGWESFAQETEKVQSLCVRTSGLMVTFTISLRLSKIQESGDLNCIWLTYLNGTLVEFFKQDHKLQVQSLRKEKLMPNPEWGPLSGVWNLLQKVRETIAISRDYLSAYLFLWALLAAFWAHYSFILMKHRYIFMQHPCCSTALVWRVMNSRFGSFLF